MDPAHLIALYEESGSTSELARRLELPYSTVRSRLVSAGIETRSTGYRSPKAISHRGPDHHKWRGGTYLTADGYVAQYAPDHPDAAPRKGYVLQHRLVAEQIVGRPLRRSEIVHHRNHDRADNRPTNLEVTTRSRHIRGHKNHAPRTLSGRFTANQSR